MSDPYWFHKKWGLNLNVPMDDVYERLTQLENEVNKLKEENIELTNSLYEVENRLQAKIDNIHPVTYNLSNYTLDK
jgi:predicted  nucleic acid-binding Zn-ribbon protein